MQFVVNNEVTRAAIWIAEQVAIPLGAVFVGAWFAFRNDRRKDIEAERERQLTAAHQLMFAMLEQYQDLCNLREFIGEIEPDHLLLTVMNAAHINKQDLAFIARSGPDDLNQAVLAEHQYLQACDALVTYNEYTRPVQCFCMENAVDNKPNGKITVEFVGEVNPRFTALKNQKSGAYNQLRQAVNEGLRLNQEASNKLQCFFKSHFPNEHFWKPAFPERNRTEVSPISSKKKGVHEGG